jgi:hypothetical protein
MRIPPSRPDTMVQAGMTAAQLADFIRKQAEESLH